MWWLNDNDNGSIKCGVNFLLFYIGVILDLDIFKIVIFGVFMIGVKWVVLILFKFEIVK